LGLAPSRTLRLYRHVVGYLLDNHPIPFTTHREQIKTLHFATKLLDQPDGLGPVERDAIASAPSSSLGDRFYEYWTMFETFCTRFPEIDASLKLAFFL
jgi:hypothetical protein